ncbi:hypothetical protein WA026_013829 [Henosepilachna vigintioctopunctata]|uniref:E3 ubiquitin-protein ligase E3D n=1 Tax=Henosepilachna vigintioctopunctata TaxID=420089 RepID=A0AAW1UT18_9CUCU
METPLDKIFIELRPRVRTGNVFIKMKHNINPNNYRINLKSKGFELINGLIIIAVNFPGNYLLVENSLSSLSFGPDYIYFHFNLHTFNKVLGSIKTEFVETPSMPLVRKQKIKLLPDISYKLHCVNCLQTLNESINFKRILPLPSSHIDPSEWFCHKHDNDKALISFSPSITELFFNSCYFHINENNLENITIKSKFIACKRCLFWLGLKSEHHFKSWFHNIKFISNDKNECSSAKDDILLTISEIVNQSFLGSVKILFECQCSENQTNYLFLWILDKNLTILLGDNETDLKEHTAYKILYNFVNDKEIVKKWIDDCYTSCIVVSKLMMVCILKQLNEYHKSLPESFSTSNGLKISYLLISEE